MSIVNNSNFNMPSLNGLVDINADSELVNTETGISPFGEAKKKSKQQTLNEFYGKPNDDETD